MSTSRTDSGQIISRLESILVEEEQAARRLLAALEAETAALGGRDADALARATTEKTRALESLETLERGRREFCGRFGAGPTQADLDAWLAAYADGSPQAVALRQRWRSLNDLVQSCRKINHANGLVVASLQRRVQQALNLLRSGSAEPPVYGPSGNSLSTPSARAIARA